MTRDGNTIWPSMRISRQMGERSSISENVIERLCAGVGATVLSLGHGIQLIRSVIVTA
jgi:hypothetical protein